MKIDGVAYRSVWVDADDGWSVHIIDQTKLPWALEIVRLTDATQARARDPLDAGARRAADRRRRRLWAVPGVAAGPVDRGDGARRGAAGGNAADRDQSALGAGAHADPAAQHAAGAERVARRLCRGGRDRRRGRGAERGDRPARAAADRAGGAARASGERADPLQRRLAGDGRLGHRAGADLHGASMPASTCMSGSTRRGRATRAPR